MGKHSQELYERAARLLPGGVNSPVRAFKAVGGTPLFVERGEGPYLYDVDGKRYVDYVLSWGPLILGHSHPEVLQAVRETASKGLTFGAPNPYEVELAMAISQAVPSMEMMRLVTSGTEAAMSAIRLARAATGRDLVVKFEGCYHGHSDGLLAKAGSGAATFGIPSGPGVPRDAAKDTLSLPYNDLEAVTSTFYQQGQDIACVIVEPVAGNMGVVPPLPDFLPGLRKMTQDYGSQLIFDEVITGFRLCYGGAQSIFGVRPDITCLGKIIGGGLPVGAYGGRRDLMELIAPIGPVYQAGTLAGNPVAMAAGAATLRVLSRPGVYKGLEESSNYLAQGISALIKETGVRAIVNRMGSLITLFFNPGPVVDYKTAAVSDTGLFSRFFHRMLEQGIYLPPSQFESWFLSTAHTREELDATLTAVGVALGEAGA